MYCANRHLIYIYFDSALYGLTLCALTLYS